MFHQQRSAEQEYMTEAHDHVLELQGLESCSPFYGRQTNKQPVTWRCCNPICRERSDAMYFEFESENCLCPKCGAGHPVVQKRVLIHLLIADMKGPIVGDKGLRYQLLCDAKRAYTATKRNGEAATGDLMQVNCPGCLKKAKMGQVRAINGCWVQITQG